MAALVATSVSVFAGSAAAQQPAQPAPWPIPPGWQIPQIPGVPGVPGLPGTQPAQPGYGQPAQPGYGQPAQPGYGQPAPGYGGGYYPPPPPAKDPDSTTLEVGYLYGTSIAWGVGSGVMLDYALGIEGALVIVPPLTLGIVAPVGVFIADRLYDPMPRGLPSAIASGMWVFGGLGLGITSSIVVNQTGSTEGDFTAVAIGTFAGSLLGAGAGAAGWWFLDLEPETNLFIFSGVTQGTILGSQFGGGAMANETWRTLNDGLSVGGLIGYGVGLGATATISWFYKPSWDQIGWSWGGLAIGEAVGLIGYPIVLATDEPWNRGLIIQGVAGALGLGTALALADPDDGEWYAEAPLDPTKVHVLGGGFRPIVSQQFALNGSGGPPSTSTSYASSVVALPNSQQTLSGVEAYVSGVW